MSIDIQDIELKVPQKARPKAAKKNPLDFLNQDLSLFGTRLNDRKKERFYSELNVLFSAGVDIRSALDLIEEEQTGKGEKQLFAGIKEDVVKGSTLSNAMEQTGKFSPYEYFSLRIGEESGRLPEVLLDLSEYYARKIKQSRQVISALSYPVIIFFTAIGTIYFMLGFIVPLFEDVFKRFGGELPALTRLIIDLSESASAAGYYLLLAFLSLFVIIATQRKKLWFRKATSWMVLRLPVIGKMVKKVFVARFCHSMNLLTGANTPLMESIQLVEKMIGFYPIESSLQKVRDKILHGSSLNEALADFPIYEKRMVYLVKVAEEVNKLDLIFEKLAQQYNDEVEHQSSLLSSILEPFLIIFIGLFIAIILVAMYLPLFNLSNSIG